MKRTLYAAAFGIALCTSLLAPQAVAWAGEEEANQPPSASAAELQATDVKTDADLANVGQFEHIGAEDAGAENPEGPFNGPDGEPATQEPKQPADKQQAASLSAAAEEGESAVMAASDTTASAMAAQAVAVADGVYTIASAVDGSKCVDVAGGSSANGAAVQLYVQNVTPAQRWSIRSVGSDLYEIVNVGSGKALDVAGGRRASGTAVQQYAPNSTAAQRWKIISDSSGLYKLVSALSDSLVLDVSGGSSANGARIQIWSDNGTKAQRWSLVPARVIEDGFYVVKNNASGKALDVSGGSLANSANVQQYTANNTSAQTFQFAYNSSTGYYTITDLGSGKVLDVAGGSSTRGANVQQYTTNGTRAQKWAAVKNANGSYTLRSAVSGLALDVSGASSANSANVQVWTDNGTNAQKWTLSKVSSWLPEGAYTVMSALNAGNVLDISSGSVNSGANIQVYSSNSTNAQRFYLRPTGSGYYTIQNPISGKYLTASRKASGGNAVLGEEQLQFKVAFGPGGITFQLKDNANLALDVTGASTKSGANLQVYASNGTLAQKFIVRSTDLFADDTYSIRYAANVAYVMDVPSASNVDGMQLQLYTANGSAAQRFKLKRVAADTYQIVATNSGKAIQPLLVGGTTYQLQQRTITGATNQQWIIALNADGSVKLSSKANPNLCIDLSGAAVANGTPLIAYTANGSNAQKWKLASSRESTTYDVLGLTLRRMAELQKEDGSNSGLTVAQLMDLLDPSKVDKTQFLDIRTTTGVTATQLNDFVMSTSTGQSGILKGLGSSFVSAANQYGLNEVYLLAHAILESGWGTSTLAQGYRYEGGYIDGKYYAAGTYYNFYGIGAYDSSPLSGGRKLAIINGWNTPEKAVTGAAQWIARNYVYATTYSQPTLYAMKWDYARSNATGSRGWHQYATSTTWPDSIAKLINQCYARLGGNSNQNYVIPRYK